MLAKLKKKLIRKYVTTVYGDKVVIESRRDLLLLLRATNHLDRLLLSHIPFEVEQLEFLLRLIRANDVELFVDVGANIGLYSLTLAKADTKIKQIVAIEAQMENYNQLCGNIFLNGVDNHIETRHIGVSNTTGTARFLKNKGGSTGTSRIQSTAPAWTKFHKFEEHTIKVDTLDNLLGPIIGKTICFKIDVEGHEYQVLQGMQQLLKNNHCLFQMEIQGDREKIISIMQADFGLKKFHNIGVDAYFRSGF